jgi:hypothetical protein
MDKTCGNCKWFNEYHETERHVFNGLFGIREIERTNSRMECRAPDDVAVSDGPRPDSPACPAFAPKEASDGH